jgi:hypothetical protein
VHPNSGAVPFAPAVIVRVHVHHCLATVDGLADDVGVAGVPRFEPSKKQQSGFHDATTTSSPVAWE